MAVMYSYSNRISLPLHEIEHIKKQMHDIEFDTMYGFYEYQNIYTEAKLIMEHSLAKYT